MTDSFCLLIKKNTNQLYSSFSQTILHMLFREYTANVGRTQNRLFYFFQTQPDGRSQTLLTTGDTFL